MRCASTITAAATLALAALVGTATTEAATVQVIRGAGFGHGIGMSQYGAYGLAQHGWGYQRILSHYYKRTALGQVPSRPVRVLMQASDPYVRFRGATRASGGLALDPGVTHVVRPSGRHRLALYGRGGERLGTFSAPLRASRPGGKPVRLLGPAINGVSGGRYRGTLELHPGSAGGVTAVDAVALDDYVRGVVAGEVPASWDPDALRTQAVAARTYALATRKIDGGIFDQYPDTRSQMYVGANGETRATNAAVRTTAGEIVTYAGEPAVTYYFSTSGGKTENVEYSFVGSAPKPWLKSVDDPYDDISPKHRWHVRFSNARMGALLGAPGTLRQVKVLQRGKSPRVVRARIYGSRGTRALTGPEIRARLGLDDTWAYFTRISTSQANRARVSRRPHHATALRALHGAFVPPPSSHRLMLEHRTGPGRWTHAAMIRADARGRYSTAVSHIGDYRVRADGIAGPVVHVR